MTIANLDFGKNLRPSTVDAMNKINELVDAVNNMDGGDIEDMKKQIATLETKADVATERINNNANDIIAIKQVNTDQQTDIDAIKVTLYTPLSSTESTS